MPFGIPSRAQYPRQVLHVHTMYVIHSKLACVAYCMIVQLYCILHVISISRTLKFQNKVFTLLWAPCYQRGPYIAVHVKIQDK